MRVASLAVGIAVLICSGTSAQNIDPALVARSAEWTAAMKSKDAAKLASFYTEDALAFSEASLAGTRKNVSRNSPSCQARSCQARRLDTMARIATRPEHSPRQV